MYEIDNNLLYIITEQENRIIRKLYNSGRIEDIFMDDITIGLEETVEIPITYKKFNLNTKAYELDNSVNKTVDVYVNGTVMTTEPITNGEGIIEFESLEPGLFEIVVENSRCEVTVNG